MWQRFTELARRAVFLAQEEAVRLGEVHVGTVHLVLGLIGNERCVAVRLLQMLDVTPDQLRAAVERQVLRGDGASVQDMQLSPNAARAIDLAYEEVERMGGKYIGTEHLLLGLIREEEGLGGRVLRQAGASLGRVTAEIDRLLAGHRS